MAVGNGFQIIFDACIFTRNVQYPITVFVNGKTPAYINIGGINTCDDPTKVRFILLVELAQVEDITKIQYIINDIQFSDVQSNVIIFGREGLTWNETVKLSNNDTISIPSKAGVLDFYSTYYFYDENECECICDEF